MNIDEIPDKIKSMNKACSPLKISVHLVVEEDRYYIGFDWRNSLLREATPSSKNTEEFVNIGDYWGAYDKFAETMLQLEGFNTKCIVTSGDVAEPNTLAFIGTLFDLLKQ